MHNDVAVQEAEHSKRLFLSLADQLNHVCLQMVRMSELTPHTPAMRVLADTLLQLTNTYVLAFRTAHPGGVAREPVALSGLLTESAHLLQPYATQYGVSLHIDVPPQLQLVAAEPLVLRTAIVGLGQVFVRAAAESDAPGGVRLAAHRSRHGVVAGVYTDQHEALTAPVLRRALTMKGSVPQPLGKLVSGPAAEVFMAHALIDSLMTTLRVGRFRSLTGLAATLPSCSQLELCV